MAQLAICDEIVSWLRHLKAPLRHERRGPCARPHRRGRSRWIVPGHAAHGQTLSRALLSDAVERATHEAWIAAGGTTLAERAGRRVEHPARRAPRPEPLPCDDELLAIVTEAERRVAGRRFQGKRRLPGLTLRPGASAVAGLRPWALTARPSRAERTARADRLLDRRDQSPAKLPELSAQRSDLRLDEGRARAV